MKNVMLFFYQTSHVGSISVAKLTRAFKAKNFYQHINFSLLQ